MEINKCCICKSDYTGWGHDPDPIKSRGRCCDRCHFSRVVPAKLEQLKDWQRKADEKKHKQNG